MPKLIGAGLAILATATLMIAPYITHIVWCIREADRTGSAIALLIIGIMVPPIGWLHGLSVWFGAGWV